MTGIDDERAVQAAILHGHAARLLDFPLPDDEATPAPPRPALVAPDLIRAIADRDAPIGSFTRLFDPPLGGTQGLDDTARLAGVPFAVKDLFDVAGYPTTAGAALRRNVPLAHTDATVVARLRAAGAVLVGTCNMDEFAYGFATVNAHYGTTRNPHDLERLAGGSSGGSAAAVAAGLVPLALGSDTNGSIRVPAALCGAYGLRPTHGELPIEGVFPFVDALDVPGPLADSLALLRTAYEVMADRTMRRIDVAGLRIARLGGWFARNVDPALASGIDAVAAELGATGVATWPEAERARSAAYVLTAAEGGARHLADLRAQPDAFDPAVRDRLLAGAATPAAALVAAQRFAGWFSGAMAAFWDTVDVAIAPTVPCVAPRIDEGLIEIDGAMMSARAQLGLFTQPISLAGCPVLAVPLLRPGRLPLGIQLVAAPGREDRLFAVAERLETAGLTGVSAPGPR
ncbi:AtzE family amidohydrolase [uncultured Sphingomonas sp.]|uniref:AtzE family amidohydrolase n=1 Tax=uncultured Sphingomonas sp. TaxID=158754 RepID=UPI0035CBA666